MQQQFRTAITQINHHFNALFNRARWPQHWRRERKLLATLALALCLGVPAFAVVQGSFSDVPPSAFYYNAVEAIYHAGITSGCATGLYCPENSVTRGQMAVFMQRGFGRIYYAKGNFRGLPTDQTSVNIAEITIDTTNKVSGQGQSVFVKLDGKLWARTNTSTSCAPCVIRYAILEANEVFGGQGGSVSFVTPHVQSTTGTDTLAVEVPTGVQRIYRLVAFFAEGSPATNIAVAGSLTAITAPFGSLTPPTP